MSDREPYTREDVEGLAHFLEASDFFEKNGIPFPKELKTLEELKQLLLRKLSENEPSETKTRNDEGIGNLQSVLEKDQAMRRDLSQIYMDLHRLLGYKTFESDIKEELLLQYKGKDDEFDQIEEMIALYNNELVNQDCPIVVAGETGAGKSSFLNLLVGEEVLPYSVLSATSTICRLVNSEQKKYMVQFRDGSRTKEKTLAKDCSGEKLREELDQYVYIRDRETPSFDAREVTIFWPIPMLQGNVSIVDTPGIGESPEMTEQLLKFLPKAVAFVFVINSGNAGGVHYERLGDLLRRQSENVESQYLQVFDPSAAIFVCNQWDRIPDNEKILVEKDTIRKLKNHWPGFKEEQIFMLSTTEAIRTTRSGLGIDDLHRKLLDGIQTLVLRSLGLKTKAHMRFLTNFIYKLQKRLMETIINSKKTREQKKEREVHVLQRLTKLEDCAADIMLNLQKDIVKKGEDLVKNMSGHLDSPATRMRLTEWNSGELPDGDAIEDIKQAAEFKIRDAITSELKTWNEQTQNVVEIYKRLRKSFKESFQLLDDEFQEVANILKDEEDRGLMGFGALPLESQDIDDHMFGFKEKIILGLTSPLWVPFAITAVVLALPVIGVLFLQDMVRCRQELQRYRKDKVAVMKEWTNSALDLITRDKTVRRQLFEEQMSIFNAVLEAMRDDVIPRRINADRMLISNLSKDQRNQDTIIKLLRPHLRQCKEIMGQSKLFRLKYYDEDKINTADIIQGKEIGRGTFSVVFKGEWRMAHKQTLAVAMKKMTKSLSKAMAFNQLSEVDILRSLNHPNIVKLYGVILSQEEQLSLSMVTELCSSTLMEVIFRTRALHVPADYEPGSPERLGAFRFFKDTAQQIVSGVLYLHQMDYVHRDLKLNNILVDEHGKIKISDVGYCTPEDAITGTLAGTITHVSPEVWLNKPYGKPTDIYSFGIILWEMWYGKPNPRDLDSISFKTAVLEGKRPNFKEGFPPSQPLADFMSQCWDHFPEKRPVITTCLFTVLHLEDRGQGIELYSRT